MNDRSIFIRYPFAAAMLAAMTVLGSCNTAGEKAEAQASPNQKVVRQSDVPAKAMTTINTQAGGEVTEVRTFQEDGKTMYLGETIKDGRKVGIEVYATGEVCCVETEAKAEELPAAAKRVIDSETLGWPTRVFMRKDSKGKTTWVVDAATITKTKHIEVDDSGKVVAKRMEMRN